MTSEKDSKPHQLPRKHAPASYHNDRKYHILFHCPFTLTSTQSTTIEHVILITTRTLTYTQHPVYSNFFTRILPYRPRSPLPRPLARSCSPVQSTHPRTQNGNTKPRPRPQLPTRRPRPKHPLRLPSFLQQHTASHAPTATHAKRARRPRQQHRQRCALLASRSRHTGKDRKERSRSRKAIRTLPLRAHSPDSVCRYAGGGVGCDTSLEPYSQ